MAITNTFQDALYSDAKKRRYPVCVNFELLPICNLDCKMCYIHTSPYKVRELGGLKSVDDWLELARQMRECGTLFLLLTGGEVFLYPDLKRLYIELYKMGFFITINTNGTMIDDKAVSWLSQYPPKCVSISLYGATNETYERICGKKGMFSKVDRTVKLLKENCIRFELKTMYTPLNKCDWESCREYAERFGVYYEAATYAFPPSRKKEAESQIRFSAIECAGLMIDDNRRTSVCEDDFRKKILGHLCKYEKGKTREGFDLYGFTCGAANNSCWITWQGYMTPCAILEKPYALPYEVGFKHAWEQLKESSDQILMSPKCSHCDKRDVCTVCPAACFAETGSFEKHSPYHCQMTEYTLNEMKRLVQEWNLQDQIKTKEK